MTTFRIVIRVTTTEDFEFKVDANTREEARGKTLAHNLDNQGNRIIHKTREIRFVSTKELGISQRALNSIDADEIPPNKMDS